jgi:ABC-2 type transport system permease protein
MTAFFHHFMYDFRVGLRNKSLLLLNYLFPLGVYILMGMLLTGLNPTFAPTMIPAMVLVTMMSCTLLGMPNPVVESREAGIFRSFRINGVPALSIIIIPMLTSFVHIALVSTFITFTAGPFFDAGIPTHWGYYVLILLLASFTFAALGMLIGVASPNMNAVPLFSQLIFLPSMLLGGLMIPSEMLPPFLYRISLLLPTTHAMTAWRGLAFGMSTTYDPLWGVLVLLTSGILAFCLAVYLFTWDSKNRRKGHNPLLALLAMIPFVVSMILLPVK